MKIYFQHNDDRDDASIGSDHFTPDASETAAWRTFPIIAVVVHHTAKTSATGIARSGKEIDLTVSPSP
jgi:hypothetical protein